MDLSELDVVAAADRGAELTLLHPGTGEPGDAVLHVLGYDSETVLAAGRSVERGALSAKSKMDFVDLRDRTRIAKAIAAVTSVTGLTFDGTKIAAPEALAEYLRKPGYSWIVDQIEAFGADRANVFPKPPVD